MPIVPSDFVIIASLKVGVIYKFEAPELITTEIPHHFIVIAIENSNNYLLLCTTQLHNKISFFQKKRIDLNTLAYITPNENNGLTKDTYVDCNSYYRITTESLIQKVKTKSFSITGNLSYEEYKILLTAIELSITFDIPKKLLVYESKL